jgi:predicted nucleotidyltransferase
VRAPSHHCVAGSGNGASRRCRSRLRDTLGPNDCSVWLYSCGEACGYGSLARGDWDGFSDIDLLVVAANQDAAERAADQLIEALVDDDVLAIDQGRWQAMDHLPIASLAGDPRPGDPPPSGAMSQARPMALYRSGGGPLDLPAPESRRRA